LRILQIFCFWNGSPEEVLNEVDGALVVDRIVISVCLGLQEVPLEVRMQKLTNAVLCRK
jgi:hypothetical protein